MNVTATAVDIAGQKKLRKDRSSDFADTSGARGNDLWAGRRKWRRKNDSDQMHARLFAISMRAILRFFAVSSYRTEARKRFAFLPENFVPPYYLTAKAFLKCMARDVRA